MAGLTTAEAARVAGVDASAIRHAIRRGHLRATKHGRDWEITRKDLDAWLSNPDYHKTGPKRK